MEFPLIFDIKRHALEDGPGIRTTVFFKGCNLNCVWCHNPESIEEIAEIGFYPSRCIACGECERACRLEGVCNLGNPRRIERVGCSRCGDCVRACPSRALRLIGRYYAEDELIDILLRDLVFYEVSGGGVTFSGGEPTLFMDYLSTVMSRLKNRGIQTAIQTNGNFQWQQFEDRLLDFVDIIMLDLKLADPGEHLKYSRGSNQLILENLARLLQQKKAMVIPRIPLIPGLTASGRNLKSLALILRGFKARAELLPYNPMGISKWEAIGKKVPYDLPQEMIEEKEEKHWREIFRDGVI